MYHATRGKNQKGYQVHLRRTQLLNAQASEPLAPVDGVGEGVTINNTGAETAGKSITGTVGVVDLLLGKRVNRVLLNLILTLDGNNGGLGTLGDYGNTLALSVNLGEVSESLGNLLNISQAKLVRLGVGSGLGLVANHVVPVRGRSIKGLLEELRDEGSREGEDEGLVLPGGLLGELHDGGRADSEVVTADIVGLGVLNESPDIRTLQMLKVVVVGGAELGAHTPVVAGDDNATAAGRDLGVHTVLNTEASLLAGLAEDIGVLVVANTTEVDDAVGRQEVLGTTGSVLGGATGNQLGIVVVEEVLVDASMLLLSEDGIVGLEAILLEEGLVAEGLNVCTHRQVSLHTGKLRELKIPV